MDLWVYFLTFLLLGFGLYWVYSWALYLVLYHHSESGYYIVWGYIVIMSSVMIKISYLLSIKYDGIIRHIVYAFFISLTSCFLIIAIAAVTHNTSILSLESISLQTLYYTGIILIISFFVSIASDIIYRLIKEKL
jgi:membrane protease YdiL (CAAX protease family)